MKGILRLLSCVALFISISASAKESIKLRADLWCPYNCKPDDKDRPGFLVEIAKAAFVNYNVDYQLQPWSRALRDAERGVIDGVIGASQGELKGGLYTKKALGSMQTCVFTSVDSKLKYKSSKDLSNVKLAVINDYVYSDAFMEFIKKNPKSIDTISGDNALDLNVKKVEAGRVDALVEDKNVLNYHLLISGQKMRNAGCEESSGLYISFGEKNPRAKKLIEILDQWTEAAEKSGELSKIRKKYNMEN